MSRFGLLSSEPIRPQMAGIGIRYLELARRLAARGLDIVLVSPSEPSEAERLGLGNVEARRFEGGRLDELFVDCDGALAQGQLANDLVLELPELPVAIDLYDPFLIENLHYVESLGLDPYRNDHATWVLQLSRGDFFLCSCDEQRQYYLGFLTALGRVNPRLVARDPDLAELIAVVPFGIPETLPAHRSLLPKRRPGEKRILFGGLYDWYDPWPVLEALRSAGKPGWKLYFVRNPNPGETPQRLFAEVEEWSRRHGLWDGRIEVLDWIPAERRYDLLRDVDLLVSTHRPSLETRLSLRTRFLDALAAGCPVVATEGGAMSRFLGERGAGWLVPPEDAAAVAAAVSEILARGETVARRQRQARELAEEFCWARVLEPLLDFAERPRREATKDLFAFRPPTLAPRDRLGFRLRRWMTRQLSKDPAA